MKNIMTIKEFGVILMFGLATAAILYPLLQVVDMGTTAYIDGEL